MRNEITKKLKSQDGRRNRSEKEESRIRTRQSDRQKKGGKERETVQRNKQIREKQSREIEREGMGGREKDCIAGVLHSMLGEGSGTHPLDQTVHGRMRQVVSFQHV